MSREDEHPSEPKGRRPKIALASSLISKSHFTPSDLGTGSSDDFNYFWFWFKTVKIDK